MTHPDITVTFQILDSPGKICSFVQDVGKNGYTFSPATFLNGSKKIDNFEQMQILVLDFDGGISYEAVKGRARQYGLQFPVGVNYKNNLQKNKRNCYLPPIFHTYLIT